jgi:hypothetical protein
VVRQLSDKTDRKKKDGEEIPGSDFANGKLATAEAQQELKPIACLAEVLKSVKSMCVFNLPGAKFE